MIDDIGLGQALANMVYLFILFITISGVGASFFAKNFIFAFWWVSLMANIFVFLYLSGGHGDFVYLMQFFSLFVWPIINIGLLIYIIRRGQRSKNEKINKK